jgi:hypothetical protein
VLAGLDGLVGGDVVLAGDVPQGLVAVAVDFVVDVTFFGVLAVPSDEDGPQQGVQLVGGPVPGVDGDAGAQPFEGGLGAEEGGGGRAVDEEAGAGEVAGSSWSASASHRRS